MDDPAHAYLVAAWGPDPRDQDWWRSHYPPDTDVTALTREFHPFGPTTTLMRVPCADLAALDEPRYQARPRPAQRLVLEPVATTAGPRPCGQAGCPVCAPKPAPTKEAV